jgi:hypothetical protein
MALGFGTIVVAQAPWYAKIWRISAAGKRAADEATGVD